MIVRVRDVRAVISWIKRIPKRIAKLISGAGT